MTDHLTTPMTIKEWRFVRILLRQGDTAADWPRGGMRQTGDRISTPMTLAFVRALIQGDTFPHDHPSYRTLIMQLIHAQDAIANRIASDLDPTAFKLFSPAEWNAMDLSYHTLNGDPEVYEPGRPCGLGSAWCWYYAKKIEHLYYEALTPPNAAPEYPPEATPQANPDVDSREYDMQIGITALLEDIERGRSIRDALSMAYTDGWHRGFTDGLSEARQHSR